MARRLLLGLLIGLAIAAPAAADTILGKKQSVDEKIAELREQLQETRVQEEALKREIASFSEQILELSQQVGDVSERLVPLERELELRELKLNRLNALYQLQTERWTFLRRQYRVAVERLNARLVDVYEADGPGEIEFLLSASSFSDLLDAIDYVRQIADQDKRISEAVAAAKAEVAAARKRTQRARASVQTQAEAIAVRVRQVRELRERLLASQSRLEGARSRKKASLDSLSEEERNAAREIDALAAVSAQLAAKIQAAQGGTPTAPPPPGGFVWPVSAPITSPFGWRWGRMHEGIDLGAGEGTSIAAAAGGTVIQAGWLGGYGNLVVIDHGGGIATAYAHQSTIAVGAGQQVVQGQTIGYVGNTGYSFGSHLHFEVRVGGSAVDPLGYL